jgi:hypothetical protein
MDRGASTSVCVVESVEAVEAVELELVLVVVGVEEVDEKGLIGDMAARIAAVLQHGHVRICCTIENMESIFISCSTERETEGEG